MSGLQDAASSYSKALVQPTVAVLFIRRAAEPTDTFWNTIIFNTTKSD